MLVCLLPFIFLFAGLATCAVKPVEPCACMLFRDTPAACYEAARRQEVDSVTGKGQEEEGRRMREGYKGSRISDGQELSPLREAITGGGGGEHAGTACHRAYW